MHRDGPLIVDAPAPGAVAAVRVQAPGRLHLGFLDPGASLGRRFGSLGLVIDGFETVVELRRAAADRAEVLDASGEAELSRAQAHVEAMRAATGEHAPLLLRIERVLPQHAGFGSGTQLGLAVGRAFAMLFDLPLSTPQIARITGRGLRSGVGIAGFDEGGLLLDGGPGADGAPAPLLSRLELPLAWRVVVVQHAGATGLHGAAERAALAHLPPLPRESSAEICHEVLMRILAGAASGDIVAFATGITRIQRILGGHFAPAQQGRVFVSPAVARLVDALGEQGAGTGQSSWGPTGFAVFGSQAAAESALASAQQAGVIDAGLDVRIVEARRRGADVQVFMADAAA